MLAVPKQRPKTGEEPFLGLAGSDIAPTVKDFWRWSASDLLNNTTRGVLAEFLVAHALGLHKEGFRVEWDAFDLTTSDGLKVEVKSAAYIQSWPQMQLSPISFNVTPKKRSWDAAVDRVHWYDPPRRVADVYVLCLLETTDAEKINPLDVSQWVFYVAPTSLLDAEIGAQKTVGLATLRRFATEVRDYARLGKVIRDQAGGSPALEMDGEKARTAGSK